MQCSGDSGKWWNESEELAKYFKPALIIPLHSSRFNHLYFRCLIEITRPNLSSGFLSDSVWGAGIVALPGPDSSGNSIPACCPGRAFNYGAPRSAERAPTERTGPNTQLTPCYRHNTMTDSQCCSVMWACTVWSKRIKVKQPNLDTWIVD